MTTLVLASIVAAIPIFIWAVIFYNIRPQKKTLLFFAFLAGCFSPAIVLLYQKFWGTSMNLIFFELTPVNFKISLTEFSSGYFLQNFLVFVFGVGMMEEFVKHFAVRKEKPVGLVIVFILLLFSATIYGIYNVLMSQAFPLTYLYYVGAMWITFYIFIGLHKRLKLDSIDQVILVSIMSALGFAFIENIIYIIRVMNMPGAKTGMVVMVFLIRSLFVVMVHMLCSGIFGYYYGVAMFAGPYLKEHEVSGKKFFLVEILRKILRFAKKTIFEEEKMFEGLLLAMLVHGIYDFILEVNLNLSDVLAVFGIESTVNFPLFGIMMVVYLFGGFMFLNHLLKEKENHIKFGLVGTEAMPEKDFNDLITNIKKMEKEKNLEEELVKEKFGSEKEINELRSYIGYLKKFKLLERKYVGTKWIESEKDFEKLRKEVKEIKDEETGEKK